MASQTPCLWEKDTHIPDSVRRPNNPTTTKKEEKENKQDDIVCKSKLSVDAKEWYPSSYAKPVTSTSNIQSRLKVHKKPQEDKQMGQWGTYVDGDSPDIIRLNQIINTLTNDPGQFNQLLDIFMETLGPYFNDVVVLANAAELLVNKAIINQNFRYSGARLCYHLEEVSPEFRAALHLACTKELEHNSNKRSLVLFIAELYTQLHHQNIYGKLIFDAFKQLLALGGNDNIKCVCQALKLTGHSLEGFNKKLMDEVFAELEANKGTVEGSALILLNSVQSLRQANWGVVASNDPSSHQPENEEFFLEEPQNTVFYDTNGHPFSSEESEFLAANMHSNDDYLTDASDPDELADPEPEMDEEIQAAFKEFVRLGKR